MSQKINYEVGFNSDVSQEPRRIVFITRKTSAKVTGGAGARLMSYPHLILREAMVFQILTIVLVVVALFWDAPLEQLANPALTPNPAKAPWYFLGLQELLHYFPPIVAGVLIPTLIVVALVVIPYFDVNVQGEALWAQHQHVRFKVLVGVAAVLFVFLGIYEAWTVLLPTALVSVLAVVPYFYPSHPARAARFFYSRSLPWWGMTWLFSVART